MYHPRKALIKELSCNGRSTRSVYRDREFRELIQQTIADIANTVSEFEPLVLLAAKEHHRQIRRMASNAVELWDIPTDDLWCRDSGPLFAKDIDDKLVVSHLQFNGWGDTTDSLK